MRLVSLETDLSTGIMTLKVSGMTMAEAWLTAEAEWVVMVAREPFRMGLSRNQARAALTIVELRLYGVPETHGAITALRKIMDGDQ